MKAKVSVSQQGQDWEAPKANDLKLAIPVYLCTFMSFNAYFLHLVYSAKDYTQQVNSTPWVIQNFSW